MLARMIFYYAMNMQLSMQAHRDQDNLSYLAGSETWDLTDS